MTLATSRRFGKSRRLRRRAEFQRVFDTGQRIRGRFFTLLVTAREAGAPAHTPAPEDPAAQHARLGIVASKKLGNAVRRNRAKRLIREVFRHSPNPAGLDRVDIVVIPNAGLFEASLTNLEDDYRNLLARSATRLATARTDKHGRS